MSHGSHTRPTVVPSLVDPELDGPGGETTNHHRTVDTRAVPALAERMPALLGVAGVVLGNVHKLAAAEAIIGRGDVDIRVNNHSVSRRHARIVPVQDGSYEVEDLGSANGTYLNEQRVTQRLRLKEGDKVRLGPDVVFKFTLQDELDERYNRLLVESVSFRPEPPTATSLRSAIPWSPDSWRSRPIAQNVTYDDPAALESVVAKLQNLPPLVTSWEVEELKRLIADAQEGRRFILQGGDCAETFADCSANVLTNKLKILIQMSLVLVRGTRRPVVRIGRFAGQYAKPRSKPTETRNGVELPSYYGDLVNRPEFTAKARRPDPQLLLDGYFHAAMTLNFVRSMSTGSFSDLRRADYFDLGFFERAELPERLREDYARMARDITEGINLLTSVGDGAADDWMKVNFFTSHEALHLLYESAQTRTVPRRTGYYDLTTHLPWIGERTRALDGAHVEFFRGIANPIAVKIGPTASIEDVIDLCDTLNPDNERGKVVLVTRMGVKHAADRLPKLVSAIAASRRRVLWMCDPMHGNAITTRSGIKTRSFDDILKELHITMDVHRDCDTILGGVHFELTGDDVTECIGGDLTEESLSKNYMTACDPRLNYRQAIEMAFLLAGRLSERSHRPSSAPPRR